jgi:hypothetical protein
MLRTLPAKAGEIVSLTGCLIPVDYWRVLARGVQI